MAQSFLTLQPTLCLLMVFIRWFLEHLHLNDDQVSVMNMCGAGTKRVNEFCLWYISNDKVIVWNTMNTLLWRIETVMGRINLLIPVKCFVTFVENYGLSTTKCILFQTGQTPLYHFLLLLIKHIIIYTHPARYISECVYPWDESY